MTPTSLDQRLRAHLHEEAGSMQAEPGDPLALPSSGGRRSTAVFSGVVVLLAGLAVAGLLVLDDAPTAMSSATAEETGSQDSPAQSDAADHQDDAATADGPLVFTDVSDGAPEFGETFFFATSVVQTADAGLAHVVVTEHPVSEDESAGDPTVIHTFDPEAGWRQTSISPRELIDLHAQDGVVHAVAAAPGSDVVELGTSTDGAQSFDWVELTGADRSLTGDFVALVPGADGPQLVVHHHGEVDWPAMHAVVTDSGLDIDRYQMDQLNADGLWYIDGPAKEAFIEYRRVFETDGEQGVESESTVQAPNICSIPDLDPEREANLVAEKEGCHEPTLVTWSELGFVPPAEWLNSTTMYRVNGGELTETPHPFGNDRLDFSYDAGDRVVVEGWSGTQDREALRTRWSSVDGETWDPAADYSFGRADTWHGGDVVVEATEQALLVGPTDGSTETVVDVTGIRPGPGYVESMYPGSQFVAVTVQRLNEDDPEMVEGISDSFHSVDGVNWTTMDGLDLDSRVDGVIAGDGFDLVVTNKMSEFDPGPSVGDVAVHLAARQ